MLKGFCIAIRPREKLKPWQWCEKHVVVDKTSSIGGGMKWRLDTSPWVKDVMEVFADNRVETIVIRCATQSSKTQTLILLLCWVISEDPAPTLWVANAKDDLKQTINDRISPTFEKCKPVAEQLVNESVMEFEFSTMSLYFAGGGSKGKVKSKPIRWLFLDEVEEIPAANVYQALERTKAQWNKRRVLLSTPNLKTGIMQTFFERGDQRTLHIKCPGCAEFILIKFEQWKWDTNEATKPEGKWDFDKLAETVRWECPKCKHAVRDAPFERRKLAREAKFVAMNPTAPHHTVSFTWPSLITPWVKWRDVVEKFINARASAKKGDLEPLKSFINDDLGEPWDDQLGVIEDFGFLEARRDNYEFGEVWPEERVRFMAADRGQTGGEHYWWVVRAYGSFGKSRLISHGRCNTKAELEEIRKQHGVKVVNAMIDTGFKAQELYSFCLSTGWKAFKGDNVDYYLHRVEDRKSKTGYRTIRVIWDKTKAVAVAPDGRKMGEVGLFRYADDPTKDSLATYLQGTVGEWTIPMKTGRDYFKHITAEVRKEDEDSRGRIVSKWYQVRPDNHWKDCEKIIHVAAIITKFVAGGTAGGGGKVTTMETPEAAVNPATAVEPTKALETPNVKGRLNVRAFLNGRRS